MKSFDILVLSSYLYAIFLLTLRTKVSHKAIRLFKVFLVFLFGLSLYFMFSEGGTDLPSITKVALILPLGYVFVMIFINEITSVVKRIGLGAKRKAKGTKTNNELASKLLSTIEFLSNRKIGALVTIERDIKLSGYVNKAMLINAPVSSELLASIFIPTTPLHDGAVIIRDNTIVCAKAYYPSTERSDLPLHFGTRHRAAIGISEQTDALTVVVSEETGYVSVTINRQIDYNVSKETLNLYFEKYLKLK